ncbi:MAG: hypothetical protein FJ304_23675 [Planctomycetes bacterium]|nr:hypothetical protein [Planctomycetota bacterium]
MTLARRRLWSVLPLALVAAFALVPAGCGTEDGVTKTDVPKEPDESPNPKRDPAGGAYRILGAMYPAGEEGWYWYFKFVGPADMIATSEAGFDEMAKSVKLQAEPGKVPTMELPKGWARSGPKVVNNGGIQVRFDEVLTVDGLECTVSYVGGGAKGNLARWAKQVGAPEGGVGKATTEFAANGVKALRVDLRGPKDPRGKGGPMMGGKSQ